MQEYLLSTLVEHIQRPTMAEMLERIRTRRAVTDSSVTLEDILSDDEEQK